MIRTRELGDGLVEVNFDDEALGMSGVAIVPAEMVDDLAVEWDRVPGRERLSLVDRVSGMTYARILRPFGPAPAGRVRTAWPDEPRSGTAIEPAQFPGLGVHDGDLIDWYSVNAYAELVGWRCRFLPHFEGFAGDIVYPGDDTFELAASLSYAVDPRCRDALGGLSG